MGRLCFRLRRRLHRRSRRHNTRPTRRRPSSRRIRLWLPRHRLSILYGRHDSYGHNLRFVSRNIRLSTRHLRNARMCLTQLLSPLKIITDTI
jgi:hypothetical protein